jgi:hypothetical protein
MVPQMRGGGTTRRHMVPHGVERRRGRVDPGRLSPGLCLRDDGLLGYDSGQPTLCSGSALMFVDKALSGHGFVG